MLIFIDESGDTGFKFSKGSSRYFCMVMILFQDRDAVKRCDNRIHLLRKELHLFPTFEFHFHRNSTMIRKAFLQTMESHQFIYAGVVLDKYRLVHSIAQREVFYTYATKKLFEHTQRDFKEDRATSRTVGVVFTQIKTSVSIPCGESRNSCDSSRQKQFHGEYT